jgi:type I restriction enzyme S subunit
MNSEVVIKQATVGTQSIAVPDLGLKQIKNFLIPLPPRDVQERIAIVYERAKRLLGLRERANQLTSKIIRSVFLKMFGDPVTNPMNWPTKTIGGITVYHQQGFYTKQKYGRTGTPLLRISDMTEDGEILYENMPLLDISKKDINRFQPAVGDLLIARSGVSLGRCAVFKRENFPCVFGAYLIRFRLNRQIVLPEYVQAFLTSNRILSGLRRDISHKSAQPDINAEEIKRIIIPTPLVDLQEKFVEQVSKIKGLRKINQSPL